MKLAAPPTAPATETRKGSAQLAAPSTSAEIGCGKSSEMDLGDLDREDPPLQCVGNGPYSVLAATGITGSQDDWDLIASAGEERPPFRFLVVDRDHHQRCPV